MSHHNSVACDGMLVVAANRHREIRIPYVKSGTKERWISGVKTVYSTQSGTYDKTIDICEDSTGWGGDHALEISHQRWNLLPLNGSMGTYGDNFRGYYNWDAWGQVSIAHLSGTSPPSSGSLMSQALARTNPSRAVASVPTFIGELKDLPGLIRSLGHIALRSLGRGSRRGRSIVHEAGHDYLTWQFGLKPLIHDVANLLDFQTAVDRRVGELQRLYSGKGLKRRIVLKTQVESSSTTVYPDTSLGATLKCQRQRITKLECWATVRWKPTSPPSFRTNRQRQALARSLVLGLNAQSLTSTAWELLPWSWLADWFFDVQSFIEAHNNAVPATPVSRCVMVHRSTTDTYSRTDSNSWVSGGGGTVTLESKSRYAGGPTINTSLPFLNGGQLSILGALAATRLR